MALNPSAAVRSASASLHQQAQRAALAGALRIDEEVYAQRGAFTGMPLDRDSATSAAIAIAALVAESRSNGIPVNAPRCA